MILRQSYPEIDHEYDMWHIAKGVRKQLVSSQKPEVLPWVRAITTHLWYCAATAEGDVVRLKESWLSLPHHIANEHEWVAGETVNHCDHPPYTEEEEATRPWLGRSSAALEVVRKVVYNKRLLTDLERVRKSNSNFFSFSILNYIYISILL